jgi:hypothetical protein
VNDGSAQRSEVRSITVTFSDPVYFSGGDVNAAAAFQLRRTFDAVSVNLSAAVTTGAQGQTVVTLRFSGIGTDPESTLNGGAPSLGDGRYTLTIFSASVANHHLQPLDGSGSGVPGSNYVSPPDTTGGGPGQLRLLRLFGDVTGDGIVDQADLGILRNALNSSIGNPNYVAALDADNNGILDQTDLGQYRSRLNMNVAAVVSPPSFYVNPATGNDANDGRTAATAWKTWDKLVAAVADGTIHGGGWISPEGGLAGIDTIPTNDDKEAWYVAYQNGQRLLSGAHIYIDTSAAPLQVTAPLILPPGCEIASATNSLTNLHVDVPVSSAEVWTQPDVVNAPTVWGTTSSTSYQWTGLYEQVAGQWAQLLPIGWDGPVPNLAAALPKLEASPGSFYVDPATNRLYTHALAGGNPNTDGVARQYVPPWASTYAGRVIQVTGGEALRIGGDGGFGFDPVSSQAFGVSGVGSAEWNDISMIDSCQWARAGKHTFTAVGNDAFGLVVFRNDTAEEGPGMVFVGYWSHFVDYTSFSGVGTAMSIYDGDVTVNGWANVGTSGGSDALRNYQALIAHTNDATQGFSERLIENCNFGGYISLGGPETALAVMRNSVISGTFSTYATKSTIDRSWIGYRLPIFAGTTATMTDCILVPDASYTSEPGGLQGTVTLNRCTLDFTNGNEFSTAWLRTAPVTFRLTNSVILNRQNVYFGLISGAPYSDSITLDHCLIQGPSGFFLTRNFANNLPNLTYADAEIGIAGIAVTNTQFVPEALLDPTTYAPQPGSPAVGQAVTAINAPDYTGRIWALRQTAGAMESTYITPSHLPTLLTAPHQSVVSVGDDSFDATSANMMALPIS